MITDYTTSVIKLLFLIHKQSNVPITLFNTSIPICTIIRIFILPVHTVYTYSMNEYIQILVLPVYHHYPSIRYSTVVNFLGKRAVVERKTCYMIKPYILHVILVIYTYYNYVLRTSYYNL